MTERTILIVCFVVTFGFIAYKLSVLIMRVLNNYILKIDNDINESERLKLSAISSFDESKKKLDLIDNEIEKMRLEAEKKDILVQKNFNEKINKIVSKMIDETKKIIIFNNEEVIFNVKQSILQSISGTLRVYFDKLDEKKKKEIFKKMIFNINFKKMFD